MEATLRIQVPYIYTDPYNYGLPRSTSTNVDDKGSSSISSSIEGGNVEILSLSRQEQHHINTNAAAHTTTISPTTTGTATATETTKTDNYITSNLYLQIETLIIRQHKIVKGLIQKQRNFFPSILLIMTGLATLSMECYSNIISEIEFSVVLWEDTPLEYVKTGFYACCSALMVSFLFHFLMGDHRDGSRFGLIGCLMGWLMMMCSGIVGIVAGLGSMFVRRRMTLHHGTTTDHHSSSTSLVHDDMLYQDTKAGFVQCVKGICTLLILPPTLYLMFGTVFVFYHEMYHGWVGIVLATIYPLVKLLILFTVEQSSSIRWGYARGNLCAGVQGRSHHRQQYPPSQSKGIDCFLVIFV